MERISRILRNVPLPDVAVDFQFAIRIQTQELWVDTRVEYSTEQRTANGVVRTFDGFGDKGSARLGRRGAIRHLVYSKRWTFGTKSRFTY